MKRKHIKKALESSTPMNGIYSLIPPSKREAFKKFAAGFGFTEEKINNILSNERQRLHR